MEFRKVLGRRNLLGLCCDKGFTQSFVEKKKKKKKKIDGSDNAKGKIDESDGVDLIIFLYFYFLLLIF